MSRRHLRTCRRALITGAATALSIGVLAPAGSGAPNGDNPPANPGADTRSPQNATSQSPAFVLYRGKYKMFEARNPNVSLVPGAITRKGTIVGERLSPTRELGFRRAPDGRVRRIELPGRAGTQVDKINRRGQIVGNYSDTSPFLPAADSRGYVLRRGKMRRIDVPRARTTVPHGINDQGHVVGTYVGPRGGQHGFLLRRGRFTRVDVPGAVATEPSDINNHGTVVGIYYKADGSIHGFVRKNRRYSTIDAPRQPVAVPFDINNRGWIAGTALTPTADDPLAGARGFLVRPGVRGTFRTIRFPGAPRTLVLGIDDRGRVLGVFENPNYPPSGRVEGWATSVQLDLPMVMTQR